MQPRKILFANVPVDGHFNPLTSFAVYLKSKGHDVRWYAGDGFKQKLEKLGIQRYPFVKAKEINQFNIDEFFPQRVKLKAGVPKLKFDLKYFFVYRAPEYYADISDIYKEFPFEVLIADAAFTGSALVQNKLKVPVVSIGIFPLMQTSKDLAPYGLGLAPDNSAGGRFKQRIMRFVARNLLFRESRDEFNKIMTEHGVKKYDEILFDIPVHHSDLFLQSGVPGFEYSRSDMSETVKFVGAMRTAKDPDRKSEAPAWLDRLRGRKVVLVSQGTMEPDHNKLIVPALEALKGTDHLVLVATGYHGTEALRAGYPQDNIIIEDFMDFDLIMPQADVYVTNGGYGGTLLAIEHALPMVCAGVNEGKNEICTRIGYFNIGIDLKTEQPKPDQIKAAVDKVLADNGYKNNVGRLRDEFAGYDAPALCEQYISTLIS